MLTLGIYHSSEKNATCRPQSAKLRRLKFLATIKKHHRYLLAIVAGWILSTAFPNYDLGGAAWVAPAMIRLRLFTGFPWTPLGASQWRLTPLIQIAAVTGVHGVSFLVVWMALALYSSAQALMRNPT